MHRNTGSLTLSLWTWQPCFSVIFRKWLKFDSSSRRYTAIPLADASTISLKISTSVNISITMAMTWIKQKWQKLLYCINTYIKLFTEACTGKLTLIFFKHQKNSNIFHVVPLNLEGFSRSLDIIFEKSDDRMYAICHMYQSLAKSYAVGMYSNWLYEEKESQWKRKEGETVM